MIEIVIFCGPVVSVLAIGPKVRGLKPVGRDKNQNHDFLQRGSEAVVHM
jgi:hypothetical protein